MHFSGKCNIKFGGFLCPLGVVEEAKLIRERCKAERLALEQGQKTAGLKVLNHDKPINAAPDGHDTNHAEFVDGWQRISMAVDSGAAETVIPHKLVTSYEIQDTEASRAGVLRLSDGTAHPKLGGAASC